MLSWRQLIISYRYCILTINVMPAMPGQSKKEKYNTPSSSFWNFQISKQYSASDRYTWPMVVDKIFFFYDGSKW